MSASEAELNPQQMEAVNHLDGPTMIVAGAGSGKTRVLTHRYLNLIKSRGVGPENILYVTFTNKAANEMKRRIHEGGVTLYRDTNWISTFHSFGARVLGQNLSLVFSGEPPKTVKILNQRESENLISKLAEKHQIPLSVKARAIGSKISRAKDDCLAPKEFRESIDGSYDHADAEAAEVYGIYQSYLEKNGYFDFGDLLVKTIQLFDAAPEILEKYQNQLRYIQVDEYQDTNLAQHTLLMQLGGKYKNVCVVGDPDQTIYTWRGARMENLKDFESQLGNAKVIILDQNYRSTQNILDFANQLIGKNYSPNSSLNHSLNPSLTEEGVTQKNLWGEKGAGQKVYVKWCENEAPYIARAISNMVDEGKYTYGDFCVLFRINRISGEIETAFRKIQVPYWVRGVGFYQRREVRDALAFLGVLIDSGDDLQLLRILNLSRNGIGGASITKLENWAANNSATLLEALQNAQNISGVSAKARKGIKKFLAAYEKISREAGEAGLENKNFSGTLDAFLAEYDFYEYLDEEDSRQRDRGEEASFSSRRDNVTELLKIAAEAETLEDFLNVSSLDTDTQTGEDSQPNQVALMTVHGAKGLEYPVVMVCGMSEGLFPLPYRGNDFGEERRFIQEERRLAYVAFTRAMEKLVITFGRSEQPSRFITEAIGGRVISNSQKPKYVSLDMD